MHSVLASPAVRVTSAIFGTVIDAKDLDIIDMPPSELHPACSRYFLLREPTRKNWDFDPTTKHPAFFTAEYERKASRHSSLAAACVQSILKDRLEGVAYRKKHNIARVTNEPADDEIPQKVKKVKFVYKNENERVDNGLIGRITILSISLFDLPSMHLLKPNSPFVSLACGDWKASTEVSLHVFARVSMM